jgi:hypothetical protein
MEETSMQSDLSSHRELPGEVIVPGNNQIGSKTKKKKSLKINLKNREKKEEDN